MRAEDVKEPPLVYFNGGASPFLDMRNRAFEPEELGQRLALPLAAVLRRLPVPIIGLPWFHLRHVPTMLVVAHEVGHAVEADLQLEDAIHAIVSEAVDDAVRREAWLAWRHEVFADIYAVLCVGPAFVWALLSYLVAGATVVEQEVARGPRWGRYPTRALRLAVNARAMRELGFVADADQVTADWRAEYASHGMEAFDPDVTAVVGALLRKPLGAFGPVTEVVRWTASDQEKAVDIAARVTNGESMSAAGARQLLAATTLAFREDARAYAARDPDGTVVAAVLAARPAGVRGPVTESMTMRTADVDRKAGRALFDLLCPGGE